MNSDFSARIIEESSEKDIDQLEVYKLKEKLRIRDKQSTLPELDDLAFLKDLSLLRQIGDEIKLAIAGLLFVGKETSIQNILSQAEVIYLHYSESNQEEYDNRLDFKMPIISILDRLTEKIQNYNHITNIQVGLFRLEIHDFSEKVFQEAFLNAVSHRDYQSNGAIYVKHYSDKIIIENPGGFLDGITEKNIITHPSVPRNKLIAETLQSLKYVQRSGQGVDIMFREMVSMEKPYPEYSMYSDSVRLTLRSTLEDEKFVKFVTAEQDSKHEHMSLAELMILRYLSENKKIKLSKAQELTQSPLDEIKKTCNTLIKKGLIQLIGKEYMLTARVYENIKTSVEYAQDKVVQYIKAKEMIREYIERNGSINNTTVRELCGFSKSQARHTLKKMREEGIIISIGKSVATKYIFPNTSVQK